VRLASSFGNCSAVAPPHGRSPPTTGDLQAGKDRPQIIADNKLKKVFGQKSASMFETNKHLSRHRTAIKYGRRDNSGVLQSASLYTPLIFLQLAVQPRCPLPVCIFCCRSGDICDVRNLGVWRQVPDAHMPQPRRLIDYVVCSTISKARLIALERQNYCNRHPTATVRTSTPSPSAAWTRR